MRSGWNRMCKGPVVGRGGRSKWERTGTKCPQQLKSREGRSLRQSQKKWARVFNASMQSEILFLFHTRVIIGSYWWRVPCVLIFQIIMTI